VNLAIYYLINTTPSALSFCRKGRGKLYQINGKEKIIIDNIKNLII